MLHSRHPRRRTHCATSHQRVMPGLDPGIHERKLHMELPRLDARIKSAHDGIPRLERGRARMLPQCFNVSWGALISMRFALAFARSDFGIVTFKIPFLNVASTLSSSTSEPTGMRRSNRP